MKQMFLKKSAKKTLSLVLATLMTMSVLAAGCGKKAPDPVPESKTVVTEKHMDEDKTSLPISRDTAIVRAAKKVGPAVVGITNKAYIRDFFNRVQLAERGTGSGVIYDKSGLIVTNNHVVQGASEIVVSLSDGRSIKGTVLGADAATDLAVVKVDVDNLPVAEFGDSATLQVGEPAIAIGNPLGLEFRGSVTAGIISALNRSIEIGDRKFNLIQTDAAINPGNSGGALVNADGEVIGINSAKIAVSSVEGIGFAIPSNSVKPIIKELATKGRVVRPYLGAALIDKETADRFGFDVALHGGLFVMKVSSGGPLVLAGVRPGDVIVAFNGKKLKSVSELRSYLSDCSVGDSVELEVLRNGKTETYRVYLQEYPRDNA